MRGLVSKLVWGLVLGLIIGVTGTGYQLRQIWFECREPSRGRQIVECLNRIKPYSRLGQKFGYQVEALDLASQLSAEHWGYLMGEMRPTSYLVLLQNDYELRANGGFIGSYAVITLNQGRAEVRFQDIYVPDGQVALKGHVDQPEPLQIAFKQGTFRLANSDWQPDFVTTAKTIRWFMENGGEINPDMLLTLNLNTIKQILEITGPVVVPEYELLVSSDNIYGWLQGESEVGFFPGSTQKKDALTAAGQAVFQRFNQLNWRQKLAIGQLLLDQLEKQNLLVHSQNQDFQNWLERQSWTGIWQPADCDEPSCLAETVALVEVNLGANKANCCIQRETRHRLTVNGARLMHQIDVEFSNKSPLENPKPPYFYGGNYISYLRFYLPKEAQAIEVRASPTLPEELVDYPRPYRGLAGEALDIAQRFGFTEVGFFHTTRAGSNSQVQISYQLDTERARIYQLTILKQHGLEQSPQIIEISGERFQTDLKRDYQVSFDI